MELKDLMLPPKTEEQRQKWHAEFLEKQRIERIEREKERERTSKSLRDSLEMHAWQQQNHKQMLIDAQVEALRIIEAEKLAQQGNDNQQVIVDAGTGNHAGTEPKDKEVTAWLRETWIIEGKPGGTVFFTKLKKYVNQKGSPIVEHYSAGKDAGFRWETSAGTTGRMAKKTISNKVSIFNNKP
jgi:hypothetical protein